MVTVRTAVLALLALRFICAVHGRVSFSAGGARDRFERKFYDTCGKYNFVERYIDSIRHPKDDYLIFVFHEAGQKAHGGLGDRVAGMITALAYALRSNRTFILQGDTSFEDAFRPYFPSYATALQRSHPPERFRNGQTSSDLSWRSWEWANWNREFAGNITKFHCINPKPQEKHCALDYHYGAKYKVLKYYGNRSYLCRWVIKPSLGLRDEVARLLDMKDGADLYETSGCLLRLAMWPTEHLWRALDESLEVQFSESYTTLPSNGVPAVDSQDRTKVTPVVTSQQVGFHFRCGDSSFTAAAGAAPNPECYFDTTGAVPWKGTAFSDDHSMDSPIDEAKCGKQILEASYDAAASGGASVAVQGAVPSKQGDTQRGVLAYIASDNPDSSRQINSTLDWPFTIKPPQACHMDITKSQHCTLTTSLHWFMLSLSDAIVMQALIKPPASVYSNGPETAHIKDDEPAPISAFSRYAAIYSLSKNVIRYGVGCRSANTTALSYQTHGNWVCDPQMFY
jgi:hypothetical protein